MLSSPAGTRRLAADRRGCWVWGCSAHWVVTLKYCLQGGQRGGSSRKSSVDFSWSCVCVTNMHSFLLNVFQVIRRCIILRNITQHLLLAWKKVSHGGSHYSKHGNFPNDNFRLIPHIHPKLYHSWGCDILPCSLYSPYVLLRRPQAPDVNYSIQLLEFCLQKCDMLSQKNSVLPIPWGRRPPLSSVWWRGTPFKKHVGKIKSAPSLPALTKSKAIGSFSCSQKYQSGNEDLVETPTHYCTTKWLCSIDQLIIILGFVAWKVLEVGAVLLLWSRFTCDGRAK